MKRDNINASQIRTPGSNDPPPSMETVLDATPMIVCGSAWT